MLIDVCILCIPIVDRHMQADSDDSSDVVAKFSTKLSSLFTRKPLRILDSFRETLFTSEFIYPELITLIYPRESRRCKWKSWRWMQRPTTHFENTELNGLDSLCPPARFVPGSPWFTSLATPVQSQLVCLLPVGILNLLSSF